MFMSFNSNTMDVTSAVETSPLPEHLYIPQVSSNGVRVAQSSVPFYGLIIVFRFVLFLSDHWIVFPSIYGF